MVLLLQILLLVKQRFLLWPSLGSVFLGFSLDSGWWVLVAPVSFPCLGVRMGRASKKKKRAFFLWYVLSLFLRYGEEYILLPKRLIILRAKNQHEPFNMHCEGELNSPYSSSSHPKDCQLVVSCSKNNPARTESIAQDVLERQEETSLSFWWACCLCRTTRNSWV